MIIADYQAKTYGPQPCWELVADVLVSEVGAAPLAFRTINRSVRQMASEFRLALHKGQHGYIQIPGPMDFAIVLLGKSERLGITHCGICYDGKVLHALPGIVLYDELSVLGDSFEIIQFWARA